MRITICAIDFILVCVRASVLYQCIDSFNITTTCYNKRFENCVNTSMSRSLKRGGVLVGRRSHWLLFIILDIFTQNCPKNVMKSGHCLENEKRREEER